MSDGPSLLSLVVLAVSLILLIGLLAWWLFIITEGVYLGRRIVTWLYDVYARRYDRIKQYIPSWESATLSRPLLTALRRVPAPLVLDVATGTARLPLALFGQPAFNGHVIGLDYSRRMLAEAARKVAPIGFRINLIHQDAMKLPFDNSTFDAVTCLEALEFMPDAHVVISELVRVTRPGGLLLLTNRKGSEARMMPGKTQPTVAFAAYLRDQYKLEGVTVDIWQMDYDLVWAVKAGKSPVAPDHSLEAILRCPRCGKRALIRTSGEGSALCCTECEARIAFGSDGVIEYAASSL